MQLYFSDLADGGAGDSEWGNPPNWWEDPALSVPHGGIPGSSDDVELHAPANAGSSIVCHNLDLHDDALTLDAGTGGAVLGHMTIPLSAVFTSDTALVVTGALTVSGNNSGQIVAPTITLSGTNAAGATLIGTVTVSVGAVQLGTITGDATFTDADNGLTGAVSGTMTANGSSNNLGEAGSLIINGAGANSGTVGGNAILHGSGNNSGSVTGNLYLESGTNDGTVTGNLNIKGQRNPDGTVGLKTGLSPGTFGGLIYYHGVSGGGGGLGIGGVTMK